jgi:hypothetical protein
MLRRSLESLLAQTYPHWVATVYDDAPHDGAAGVVEAVGDRRIHYRKNAIRLGAARNIDQCFDPCSTRSGSFGSLLEDDNFFLPDFFRHAAEVIQVNNAKILLMNQLIYEEAQGRYIDGETTRGGWFREGSISPHELMAVALFNEGISNGGLIWKLDAGLDLRVGPSVAETGLHEICRSILIEEPFTFVAVPLVVWTSMEKTFSARAAETNAIISRGNQSIRSFILEYYQDSVFERAHRIAAVFGKRKDLAKTLAYCGFLRLALKTSRRPEVIEQYLKGTVRRLLTADPCREFLSRH